jgi:VWFA-related protein
VVSATFTHYAVAEVLEPGVSLEPRATPALLPALGLPGRTFILAVDTASFRALDVRVATLAADRFTRRLNPEDSVGLVVLPDGPRLPPSTSHTTVRQVLATVVGRRAPSGTFEMDVEEVVDITAAIANQSMLQSRQTVGQIVSSDSDDFGAASDSVQCSGPLAMCTEQAMSEALSAATALEHEVMQSIAGLDSLLRELQQTPGRKSVLLLSGGMPVSDRSGGLPALGDEVRRLGEQAAHANATINTIFFDPSVREAFSAGGRRLGNLSGRAFGIYTRTLSEFTEPSGGMFLVSSVGAAESEVDRIAERISSYYVLGVAPEDRDRTGRPHRLEVRVRQRDVAVTNRQLVVVPRPAN